MGTRIERQIDSILKQKKYKSFGQFALGDYKKKTKYTKTNKGLVLSSILGKLLCLDQGLTWMDMSKEDEIETILTDMFYLTYCMKELVDPKFLLSIDYDGLELIGYVPNFYSAFNASYEIAQGNETDNFWQEIVKITKSLQKKISLLSGESSKLDYQLYLLQYLSS